MENDEKSLAKAQQSQLYRLQQTIACSRLSDSGEDAKEKGAFSIQGTRPSRSLEQGYWIPRCGFRTTKGS